MPQAGQLAHQRYVRPGPLVLGADPLKFPTPRRIETETVSRRFKPSSRTTLIGEQPNPWNILQPQDVRADIEVQNSAVDVNSYGFLGKISLLSLAYLLPVELR